MLADKENLPALPSGKAARAQTTAIPHAPSRAAIAAIRDDHALFDRLDALALDAHTRERVVSLHQQMHAPPRTFGRSRRSIFARRRSARGESAARRALPPAAGVTALRGPASTVSLEQVRRLRVALATEAPSWVHAFVTAGGLLALLARLDELLAMEWREEQHGDMLLHELLRCLVALSTSEAGSDAMRRTIPAPLEALVALLYSSRTPADLDTRRLIFALLLFAVRTERARGAPLVARLLRTPPPASVTAKVDFLQRPHVHRPLRRYMRELQTVCNEFFWIFCHENNAVWDWSALDLRSATAPRVPSGMTGSVEHDAIEYITMHLRLICAMIEALGSDAPAWIDELRDAGIDQVLDSLRKASQVYYVGMHVELARAHALLAPAQSQPRQRAAVPLSASSATNRSPARSAPLVKPSAPAAHTRSPPINAALRGSHIRCISIERTQIPIRPASALSAARASPHLLNPGAP